MSDLMNRDDQQMVAFCDELAAKTAPYPMTTTYHGSQGLFDDDQGGFDTVLPSSSTTEIPPNR